MIRACAALVAKWDGNGLRRVVFLLRARQVDIVDSSIIARGIRRSDH